MPALRIGQPVWLQRDPRRRTLAYAPLDGHIDVDVAIVGGGLTGAAIAAVFAAAGVRVGLLEAGLVGRGSTAASTALLLQEPDKGLVELSAMYGAAAAKRVWQLGHLAVRDFIETLRRGRVECDLSERDTVYFTTKPEGVERLRAEYLRRRKAGFPAAWLTPGALRQRTAIAGRGAIVTRGNAQLNPYRACLGLLRSARESGAHVYELSPVGRIDRSRDHVTALTASGSMRAQQVIVATGYATPAFAPLAGRFTMSHTYVMATRPVRARERGELGLDDVLLWDTERPYHYARWTDGRRLLIGGADRPLLPPGRRAHAFREGTRELREYFESLMPALADIGFDHAWEGLFATTPDGLPYIGPHRRYPRHLFALGYGGNGMTFGFLAARLLLEYWKGRVTHDHRLFAFGRQR